MLFLLVFFLDLHRPCLTDLIQFMHVSQGNLIRRIQLMSGTDGLPCFSILFRLNVEQRQKLMRFYKRWMGSHSLFQLNDCQVLTLLLTVEQSLIISPDCLVDHLQFFLRLPDLLNIVISNVLMRLKILTQDPLYQRLYNISTSIIHKPQQIPGCNIPSIIL